MRIHEIQNELHSYVAKVRVNCGKSPLTVKTKVEAESQSQAWALLCHVYGIKNVLSVSEIVLETPKINQIRGSVSVADKTVPRSRRQPRSCHTLISQVSETDGAPKTLDPSEQRAKSLNDQAKRLQQQAKQIKAQDAVKKAQARLDSL